MKQLAIFYRDRVNQRAILYIQNNLQSVLGEYVNITNYYLNEMSEDQIIEADAYLVLYEEMLRYLVRHINDFSKVVVITRSIQRKYLQPILDIPKGTDVLVINDSRESILQTVYLIYEVGIGHLNLLPYSRELLDQGAYDAIHTVIVANDSESLIPPHIKHVYNIQNREISFETFQKLIKILDLDTPIVQRNLIQKVDDDMDTGANFRNSYLSNFLKDQMIENIVENSSQAILLLDKLLTVHYINEKAYNIFHLNSGDSFCGASLYSEDFIARDDFKDELILLENENYLVEKKTFELLNEVMGCCLILQNEKDLRDTEVSLNQQLKSRGLYAKYTFGDITHKSRSMKQCIDIAKKVAPSDYTILIRGESGTGKELLAQSIHNYSNRKHAPFVAVNCAALPESLLESELFGYEAGSFTGAQKNGKIGLFEHAQHGTIFLDEIGDISPNLQSRLLRVIQERQIMRIGSDKIINIDVRIIAATNVNLEKQIIEGTFRNDLFYRLNVISLNIAPLRERKEDILPLLKVFMGRMYGNIAAKDREVFLGYSWPGNIRELENVASYYRILGAIPDYIYSSGNQLLERNAVTQETEAVGAGLEYREGSVELEAGIGETEAGRAELAQTGAGRTELGASETASTAVQTASGTRTGTDGNGAGPVSGGTAPIGGAFNTASESGRCETAPEAGRCGTAPEAERYKTVPEAERYKTVPEVGPGITEGIPEPCRRSPTADYSKSDLQRLVLSMIAQATDAFHGIGRTALLARLTEHGINVGEGKLRSVLTELQAEGFIRANVGRTGSQITRKGIEYLSGKTGDGPSNLPIEKQES